MIIDHTQFLGNTLGAIAAEKAGIIKQGVPVIIGEAVPETQKVFLAKAQTMDSLIVFAEDIPAVLSSQALPGGGRAYETRFFGHIKGELGGNYQEKNANTVLTAAMHLYNKGVIKNTESIEKGFANVCEMTGLMGRWQTIQKQPLVICDTGHNAGGWKYLSQQIKHTPCKQRRIVFGMVDDNRASQTITAYDPLIYLCKSESARTVFNKQSAERITASLASEVEIPVGKLASTGTALNMNVRGKNIYEAMMEAYTAASKVTGEKYYPVYKNNAMHMLEVGEMTNPVIEYLDEPVVGAMVGVKYKESLEELVSKVKIVGDIKEKLSEVEKDSGRYGTIQKVYKKENDKSSSTAARNMLKGVKTEADIQCVGSWDYRTGYSVNVKTPLLNSVFYITADSHTYEDGIHLCTLTLSYVAEMDEKESSKEEK